MPLETTAEKNARLVGQEPATSVSSGDPGRPFTLKNLKAPRKFSGKGTIEIGLAVSLPLGTYSRIAPRSGLAPKKFINIGVGVVDLDYWGEIKVVLFNHCAKDFVVPSK